MKQSPKGTAADLVHVGVLQLLSAHQRPVPLQELVHPSVGDRMGSELSWLERRKHPGCCWSRRYLEGYPEALIWMVSRTLESWSCSTTCLESNLGHRGADPEEVSGSWAHPKPCRERGTGVHHQFPHLHPSSHTQRAVPTVSHCWD